MKIVWSKKTVLASEVTAALAKRWHPKTTKTLLGRLVKKGALTYDEQGRAYLYKAAVKEADCVRAESDSFFHRVLRGSLSPLLVHFVSSRKLSQDEVKELKKLLREKAK